MTPVISTSGTPHQTDISQPYSDQNKLGCMKVSPCGDKIACAVLFDSFLEMHDFNNSTGVVSNPLLLGTWPGLFPYGIYGVEFSKECSKLYASNESPPIVIQYDLSAGSPAGIIASADTVITSPFDYYGTLQNGLDGKMYLARIGSDHLGCITQPDSAGAACHYVQYYVNCGGSTYFGLPNSLVTTKGKPSYIANYDRDNIQVYPQPAGNYFNIAFEKESQLEIIISDIRGQILFNNVISKGTPVDCSGFEPGIYFLQAIAGSITYRRSLIVN
jgi:hypothetical protein